MGYERPPNIDEREHRLRYYLHLIGSTTWGMGEIRYDEGFTSPVWPRRGYAPGRPDVQHVVTLLDGARKQIADLRAEIADLQAELKPHREQRVREALMQVPEGRKLLYKKAEAEEAFLRKQEAEFWASMPTTAEEEEAAASE